MCEDGCVLRRPGCVTGVTGQFTQQFLLGSSLPITYPEETYLPGDIKDILVYTQVIID